MNFDGLPPLPEDTWEKVADRDLLPPGVLYGNRWIDLRALWEQTVKRCVLWCQLRAYRVVYAQFVTEAAVPTGADGQFSDFDRGYATGMRDSLDLIREEFGIPIPDAQLPMRMRQ